MTKFKSVKYLRQGESLNYDYQIMLPEPLCNWDVFDYWERERTESMRDNLVKEDILYEIGAEHGWLSVVLASFCKIFLIEPTKEFWPNIYETWKANGCSDNVIGCYSGLMSNKTDDDKSDLFLWPDEAKGKLIDKNKYEYINKKSIGVKQMKLDDLVERSGIIPTALNIDVEGSELEVLRGAQNTLTLHHPKLWISIHPDLMMELHSHLPKNLIEKLENLGYKSKHLATDHEEHWYFEYAN